MFSRHVFDQLAAFAEHQLDASESVRVEAHLRACERCRTALEEVRRGIAFASELEAVPMPGELANRIRTSLERGESPAASGQEAGANGRWMRVAAGILLVLAGVALYWQVNRPWARLREADSMPTAFERQGLEVHDLLKRGEMKVEFATSDEHEVWRWLGSQRAPITSLVANRSADERARFVPAGAAVRELAGGRASVIAYRIDGRPVTLMLAFEDDVLDAPSPGWWSKRVTHRRDRAGVNSLTWTVGGGTYVMVSELDGYGQRACFICHTDDKFQRPIMNLNSDSRF